VILNNNSLSFPLSPGLRAIILHHIADSFSACVLSFCSRNYSPEAGDGDNQLVEIAVDTDGSLIYISAFSCAGTLPRHAPAPETHFNFSRRDTAASLSMEQFRAWEHTFVTCCRLGNYEVEVLPLLDLEETVGVSTEY
jgi:hypothetical protein